MGRYWLVIGGNGSVDGSTGRYLGQYNSVRLSINWYWVNVLLCLYSEYLEKAEIWSGDTDP